MKEVIASGITEYIKNLTNPIAEENKKLKEELKTANIQLQEKKKINLKKVLLPLTVKLRN